MKRRPWLDIEIEILQAVYPDRPMHELVLIFRRGEAGIYNMARKLGLKKSAAFLAGPMSGRMRPGAQIGGDTRFRKGHVPANKGLRRPGWAPGRMAETQFKKGRAPSEARNYKPVGSTRIVYGNLERKVSDDTSVYPAKRWRPVHRLVWEAKNGPVKRGHIVVFRAGMHTTLEAYITVDRLECITFAENIRRNTIHRYPPELKSAIRAVAKLRRTIRKRS